MHTLRAPTLQGLILSCRTFTRWYVRQLSPKQCTEFLDLFFFLSVEFYYKIYCEEQFFGTLKLPKLKYPKTHLLFFKKNPHTVLKIISPQISWKEFFSKKSFSRAGSFFRDCKITKLGLIFLLQKINYLIVFLNCDYFISI